MPLNSLNATQEKEVSVQHVGFNSKSVDQILRALHPAPPALPPEEARIAVHDAVSRISVLYEKLRNAVEYREEHLLRKGAILRVLRRQLVLESDPVMIAHRLIRELIAARYLPNETLPESLIEEAANVVRKYQAIERVGVGGERQMKWLQGIVASELEEVLAEPVIEKALITFLYQRLSQSIFVHGERIDEMERRLQIYVCIYRSFMKADQEQAAYKYLRALAPLWMKPEEWLERPHEFADELLGVQERIEGILKSRLTQKFMRAVRPWVVSLWMLRDAIESEKEQQVLLESREDTHAAIAYTIEKREKEARGKIARGTVRAIIYLFVTKVIFALAIEVPLELYLYKEFEMFALAVNIALPPAIMFFVGLFIRKPGSANRKRILEHVDVLLMSGSPAPQQLRPVRERGGFASLFFGFMYLIMFSISFGFIGFVLFQLHFTPVAIAVFFFFLSLVSFFGYRLRGTSREIVVVRPKERLITAVGDFLALPILRVGRWLSSSVSRINIFAFVLDVIFEAPLKLFLNAMEETLLFIREKKDELSED